MLENIQLIRRHFPDWYIFIYLGSDVTSEFIVKLQTPHVILHFTGKTGIENMIERFYAIDDPSVDLMVVRDADSRVHWRDRWAIMDFVNSPFVAHTIRDHKEHSASLMGGLWALRKSAGVNIRKEYEEYRLNPEDRGIALDQNFLSCRIYPKVCDKLLVHLGKGPKGYRETVRDFPTPWNESLYCGQVEPPGFSETNTTVQRRPLPFRLKLSR